LLPNLIYVGVTEDRKPTFVDIDVETTDPTARARDLLAEHRSCEHIEVWRDEIRLCVITRAKPETTA
jgi:hypothetical protein